MWTRTLSQFDAILAAVIQLTWVSSLVKEDREAIAELHPNRHCRIWAALTRFTMMLEWFVLTAAGQRA